MDFAYWLEQDEDIPWTGFPPDYRDPKPPGPSEVFWHGRPGRDTGFGQRPAFFAASKRDADWYLQGEPGVLIGARLTPRKVGGARELAEAAVNAGARRPDIKSHSGYDGYNDNDFVYVPSVQTKLREMGFDLLMVWDQLESAEVRVAIVLDPSIIKVVETLESAG